MEPKFSTPQLRVTDICLHDLVNELMVTDTLKLAANRTVIINEISQDVFVYSEFTMVKTLIGRILDLLAKNLHNSLVRISASIYSSMVIVHFREYQTGDSVDNIIGGLMQLVPEAEKLGGYLGMSSQENDQFTVVLTIVNETNTSMNSLERLAQLLLAKDRLVRT
jgi:hypothetical protein